MKKTLSIILAVVLMLAVFAACTTEKEEQNVIHPLPETLDINNLEDCTVSISLEKGNAYVDDSGVMVMKVKVYSYDLYDMVDISSLKENDTIARRNEEVKVTELQRLESGLVRINGGEENGGFDLISNGGTVYYETGMDDAKAYYELGEVTLPVSAEFEYLDQSELDAGIKTYYPGDFLGDDAEIEYDFSPYNTTILIENGIVTKMNKTYMP